MTAVAAPLDPDAPSYERNGRDYLRVSTVLHDAGLVEARWFTEASRLRGTSLHQAVEWFHEGALDAASIDPVVEPYWRAYRAFLSDTGFTPDHVERRVFDEILGYTGRLDLEGPAPGTHAPAVIDIKTGSLPPTVGVQLAAYARLVGAYRARYCLNLRGDGTYRFESYQDRDDDAVFLAALTVAQWKRRHPC